MNKGFKTMHASLLAAAKRVLEPGLRPSFSFIAPENLRRLGSDYGGWVFCHHDNLLGSNVLLAGAGEDISFDVEFAKRYSATAIICDPTPRAIAHYDKVVERLGKQAVEGYSLTGSQPMEAYNLDGLDISQLRFVPRALSAASGEGKFYTPVDPRHVSHSLTNWQRGFTKEGEFLKVRTTSVKQVAEEFGVKTFPLIKLDIEGSELEIISDVIAVMNDESQLLVEFDGLLRKTHRDVRRAEDAVAELAQSGFYPVWGDKTNFLFVGERLIDGSQNVEKILHKG